MKSILGVIRVASLLLFVLSPTYCRIEDGYLVLQVADAAGKPMSDVGITCAEEECSTGWSDSRGVARLKLPPRIKPYHRVMLRIVNSANPPYRVLLSPWDNLVIVPPFKEGPKNRVSIVVIRKGDKEILSSGFVIESIIKRTLKAERPKLEQQIAAEERRRALQQQADEVGLTPEDVAEAIREWGRKAKDPYQKGLALLFEGDYAQATPLLEESETLSEEEEREAIAKVADRAFFTGQSLYGEGKYNEAVGQFQKAISRGKEDADVLNWLGISLHRAGKYAEVESFFKRAHAILENGYGPAHPNVAHTLKNLGSLYAEQSRYAEAELALKRARSIYVKTFGQQHPNVAHILKSLGALYTMQGRYAEAELFLKRAQAIYEKALGRKHSDVAAILNDLGEMYRLQNRYAEAEPLLKRAQAIYEKALGPEHPGGAEPLNNLGALYTAQGRYAEAEPLLKRARAIYEKALGPEHPNAANAFKNLGVFYTAQSKYAEAESFYKGALAIYKRALGPEHPNIAIVLKYYAILLRNMNRTEEATGHEARAKEIREKAKLK